MQGVRAEPGCRCHNLRVCKGACALEGVGAAWRIARGPDGTPDTGPALSVLSGLPVCVGGVRGAGKGARTTPPARAPAPA